MAVILSWAELAARLDAHRARGERIVSTNGVFDVLHVGHARYLRQARELGDLLVVGVNSDACTRRLKGPTRPFVPERERAELLDALRCVDYVTLFDEPTPEKLLAAIRPRFHAKGGDYDVETMPETPIVRQFGGEVIALPFVDGHSTTEITGKIARSLEIEEKERAEG